MASRSFWCEFPKMKRGPKETPIDLLVWWEREWHWIFHGLAFGIPAGPGFDVLWELPPPPKRPSRELYAETVRYWAQVRMRQRELANGRKWKEVKSAYHSKGTAAEPEVWQQIKCAETPNQIRAACDNSHFWLNPKAHARSYVADLRANASAFVSAKYRRPNSARPSSEKKLVLHFARVMAGITLGISPARVIDRLRQQA
jgi:hypothetical protein